MPAPQRPMRRASQQNNAVTRGASSTACRRRNPPSLRAGCKPSDAPRQTGHGQAAPGSLPQAPVIGFPRRRSPPAQHLSYPLPAEPPRSIPPTLVRQAPGRPRRTFETPVPARTFARLPPMSAFSRHRADEQTTTRKSAVRRAPQHAASASSPLPRHPRDSVPSLFPAGLGSDASAQTAEPPRTPFPKRPSFGCVPPGSSFQPGPGQAARSSRPPCFRSPRGFRLLPRAPLSLWFPRPIPRVFLAPFPAPSPHFCRTLSRLFAPHL